MHTGLIPENTHKHTHVNSQLQNEHHLSSALKNVFESHSVWMLNGLEDLNFLLYTAPVQAQTTAQTFPNLQELACPISPSGPLTNLSDLTKMPTGWGKKINS